MLLEKAWTLYLLDHVDTHCDDPRTYVLSNLLLESRNLLLDSRCTVASGLAFTCASRSVAGLCLLLVLMARYRRADAEVNMARTTVEKACLAIAGWNGAAEGRAVIFFGWVFFLISSGSPRVRPMGRTCGEPDEIELTAMEVKLNGSRQVRRRAP